VMSLYNGRFRHAGEKNPWVGDVVSLVRERAKSSNVDEEEARKIQKKIAKNKFGFFVIYYSRQADKRLGSLKDLREVSPRCGKGIKRVGCR